MLLIRRTPICNGKWYSPGAELKQESKNILKSKVEKKTNSYLCSLALSLAVEIRAKTWHHKAPIILRTIEMKRFALMQILRIIL